MAEEEKLKREKNEFANLIALGKPNNQKKVEKRKKNEFAHLVALGKMNN